jgi:sterol desaturase/sphingolipid hydroxylase (fatty acid hydroxylase superfamily)
MYDKNYEKIFSKTSLFELSGLFILALLHSPMVYLFPIGYFAWVVSLLHYYYIHRKSHLDPKWAKKHLRWHYDHHMGRDQHANWGIRTDYFDVKFKTRVRYRYLKKR